MAMALEDLSVADLSKALADVTTLAHKLREQLSGSLDPATMLMSADMARLLRHEDPLQKLPVEIALTILAYATVSADVQKECGDSNAQ